MSKKSTFWTCLLALNSDPFNLGQVDGVARAVVEVRRPGVGVVEIL